MVKYPYFLLGSISGKFSYLKLAPGVGLTNIFHLHFNDDLNSKLFTLKMELFLHQISLLQATKVQHHVPSMIHITTMTCKNYASLCPFSCNYPVSLHR